MALTPHTNITEFLARTQQTADPEPNVEAVALQMTTRTHWTGDPGDEIPSAKLKVQSATWASIFALCKTDTLTAIKAAVDAELASR